MHQTLPTRSDEPIYWLMFGGGGMIAAIVLPAILVIMIVAGLISPSINDGLLSYEQVSGLLSNWLLSLILFGVVFMLSFYALHRMYHSTHDFGIHSKLFWFAAYGAAAAISFICLGLQLLIYVRLF
ncbi:MAG: fumarate reductase subunit D [Succinivibrio sp.]|nr:fumarate reductase subunit D [Succinivibrio sp.]